MPTPDKDFAAHAAEYMPSNEQLKRLDVLKRLTDVLEREKIRYSILGGYGLDGLYGKLTRDHADLDLITDEADAPAAREWLSTMGFVIERTKASGVEVYRHAVGDLMLEFADTGALKRLSAFDENILLPESTNASLSGFTFRSATIEGHEMIRDLQLKRAQELGWRPYPHTNSQAELIQKIKERK